MKKINIKGPIIPSNAQLIYDWFEMEATSPKKIIAQLEEANGENIEIYINSGGGSVSAASEIYTALQEYRGRKIGKIVGLAGSAASFAALGVDELWMAPTAQMMMHNARAQAEGDYHDMDAASDMLKSANLAISNAYRLKTGKTYEELLDMMNAETWLSPQQALEYKLIDKIMFDDQDLLVAKVDTTPMLPQKLIDKIRNELIAGGLIQNQITNITIPTKTKEDESKMLTLEKLKNEHPDLYNKVLNEGREAGVQAERQRIQAIEELALPGNEELLSKAKFETGITAEQVAVEIIKAEKQRGANFLANRQDDASQLNNVAGSAPQDEELERQSIVSNMVGGAKKMRGVE
ncbi:Phage protein [Desulfitobacterium hafniense]|uniref:ATP-dependent Clp protease proteolytic subunit n=1 Tax=Desulfitobacterium hafniense TaxID=49338 RepID=A0A098AYV9_DESHA|nr:head maturation protease, ClpP-related [Desulfitobacterium hafniense]CDX01292.1 Phage protein [Desulfitobacterium hafniense]